MVKMHPDNPTGITNGPERQVYDWIQSTFPDGCETFYGIRWNDGIHDRESDFLVFHPDGFIILLEVKGGYEWIRENGKWRYEGGKIPLKDPDLQFIENKKSLLSVFQKKHDKKEFCLVGGLVFPEWEPGIQISNLTVSSYHMGINLDLYEWVEAEILRRFRNYVISPAKTETLIRTFSEIMTMESFPKLSIQIEKSSDIISDATMSRLEQTLDDIKSEDRMLISGRAGCGKTWLVERLAEYLYEKPDVRRILITCKTESLVNYLKQRYPQWEDKCLIEPLFVLAERMLDEKNQLSDNLKNKKLTDSKNYWKEVIDEFSQRIKTSELNFDAIIIDEAQMLNKTAWDCIEEMLGPDGYFYVFYDQEQRIYRETENSLPDFKISKKKLKYNIRNTGNIYRFATAHYRDPQVTACARVDDGLPVWLRYYSSEEDMKKAILHFRKILVNQGVNVRDIILLTPKKKKSWLYQRNPKAPMSIGKIKLEENIGARKVNPDSTLFRTTVQNFRGRERRVVILAEFDESVGDFEKLMYIGATRAKALLIVLADKNISEGHKALYADYSLDVTDCFDDYNNIMRKQLAAASV